MIDIVIPLSKESKWSDCELRYSLRSLEKFGRNIGQVFIVGECPSWINPSVIHIPCENAKGHERAIMEKILFACNDPRVSDNFLQWSDDYFLTEETDLEKYPFYCQGYLSELSAKRIPTDGYKISIDNCDRLLKSKSGTTRHFDLHCPIRYNKDLFITYVSKVDWTIRNGYLIKSLYCNSTGMQPVEMPDCKINEVLTLEKIKERLIGRHVFSIGDNGLTNVMKEFLRNSYPEKSRFEL